ncbi:MAG: hypothetical protein R6V44_18655, partial [Paracoccaceae bacterium]
MRHVVKPRAGAVHLIVGGRGLAAFDEDEAVGIETELAVEPRPPALQDGRPLLLAGGRGLISHMMPCRRKNRGIVPTPSPRSSSARRHGTTTRFAEPNVCADEVFGRDMRRRRRRKFVHLPRTH